MLDPLIEAIETVKDQIAQHQQTLRENETRTRVALIDPILKALGWDPADPALVTLEYNTEDGKADYALHGADAETKPVAIIEAKKLHELLPKHRRKMLTYANEQGIEYAGLTNGDKWELYSVFERGELIDRRFLNVSIAEDEPHECALELLSLWRLNLASGKVKKPKKSIIVNREEPSPPENREPITPEPKPDPTPTPTPEPPPDGNWVSLSKYRPQIGNPPPSAIRLPSESGRDIKYWNQILMTTAEWLCQKNLLKPVRISSNAKTYIVNDSEVGIRSPGSIDNGRYYVEKDLTCVEICRHASTLLTYCGVDPSEVFLKFANVEKGNDG